MNIELKLSDIRPGRWQPRQQFDPEKLLSLAGSIKAQGLINPIIVFANEGGEYELLAGERRWRASIALALENRGELNMNLDQAVPLVCEKDPVDLVKEYFFLAGYSIRADKRDAADTELLHQISLLDNLQRHDLSPIEEAQALADLQKEHGYSIRKLAEVTGLSKSYVDDRLKLLDLSPEVAAMASPSNGAGPQIDLTLARDLARKLAPEMQAPVANYLKLRQANAPLGDETTKKGQAVISRIARWLDPAMWDLPEGIYLPEVRNRARLMRRLIETMDPAALVAGLVKLDQPASTWETAGMLGKKPEDLIDSAYTFYKMVNTLTGKTNAAWARAPEVVAAGWTCGNCRWRDTLGQLGERSDSFDWDGPCARLKTGQPELVHTCEGFIGIDDPPLFLLPARARDFLPDAENDKMQRIQDGYPTRYYVHELADWRRLYGLAVAAKAAFDGERVQKTEAGYKAEMLLYWQAQQEGRFDLAQFQAHACLKCANFKGDQGADVFSCRLLEEPLTAKQWTGDGQGTAPRAPKFGILKTKGSSGDVVAVPRCEGFRCLFMPEIHVPKRKRGWAIPDRGLILDWYERVTRGDYFYESQNKTWGVLKWLPVDSLKKLWESLGDDDVMMVVLETGVRECRTLRDHSEKGTLLDPTTGQETTWTAVNWEQVGRLPAAEVIEVTEVSE